MSLRDYAKARDKFELDAKLKKAASRQSCSKVLLGLRPTDDEITLEARQQAEERGWTPIQRNLWEQGARWARGVAQYSKPNRSISDIDAT